MLPLIGLVRHVLSCSIVGSIVCGAVAAQQTWVVDDNGGPGVHFTDLPAAFGGVAHGDLVLVRPGNYTPARLDKAIRLLGDPGAMVVMALDDLEITAIPAQHTCVVRGLTLQQGNPFFSRGRLNVHDCDGVVVLAGLRVELPISIGGVVAQRCRGVVLEESTVRAYLSAEDSAVSATRCRFEAYNGPATPGVFAYRSTIELTHCSASGTTGFGHLASVAAIRAFESSIVLRGDSSSVYTGGTYGGLPWSPSIEGNGSSTLIVDPDVVLTPPPVGLTATTTLQMASLASTGGQLGARLDLHLASAGSQPYALFAALPTIPFDIPGIGRQWMDVPTEFLVVVGTQTTVGTTVIPIPVPLNGALRGLALTFQALAGPLPLPELTNATVAVVW